MGCINSRNGHPKVESYIVNANTKGTAAISRNKSRTGTSLECITKLKTVRSIKIKNNHLIKEGEKRIEDNYTILNKLGSGAYGDVYKVKHIKTGLTRAIKVIKK